MPGEGSPLNISSSLKMHFSSTFIFMLLPIALATAGANNVNRDDGNSMTVGNNFRIAAGPNLEHQVGMPQGFNGGRMKRDANSQDDLEDDIRHPCHYVPPNPSISNETQGPAKLMDLLNEGSQWMTPGSPDAVLLLGAKGSGKSSLAKILTHDLSQLHVVKTQGNKFVIVDDSVRVNNTLPPSPNPLVPQLMNEHDAIYNCPSFVRTFGGPEQDVAANFFMTRLMRGIRRVKLLFLLPFDATESDLDYLVSNATRFIKNANGYVNSVGLIITKVHSSEPAIDIAENIAGFLRKYLDNLLSQLDSQSDPELIREASRKIQFVEALLAQDQQKIYFRINFARAAHHCGRLVNSGSISRGKDRLTQFYDKLEYSAVSPNDFRYTFEMGDKSKMMLRNYVIPINQIIADYISSTVSDYAGAYSQNNLQNGGLVQILGRIERATAILNETLVALAASNKGNPEDFAKILITAIEKLGFTVYSGSEFYDFMSLQQMYLEFDDQVNPHGIPRQVQYWAIPVKDWYMSLLRHKKDVEMEIELEGKALEVRELRGELSKLKGEHSDWKVNEMNLLNEIDDMFAEVARE